MDTGFKIKARNPKDSANFLSKLFFTWIIKFFYHTSYKTNIKIDDLYNTTERDKSEPLGDRLERHWASELAIAKENHRDPSLLRALSKTFIWDYMLFGALQLFQFVIVQPFQPVVLSKLLIIFGQPVNDENDIQLYIYASILCILVGLFTFMYHHTNYGQAAIGMRVRVATSSVIYRKILRLDAKTLNSISAGQVVNLLSNDVNRFDQVVCTLHILWIMPVQVFIITYLLWRQVGVACLAGILTMIILTLPVQGYLGIISRQLRLEATLKTDRRVKLMNEVITGMYVIKVYAWEKPFEQIIKLIRKEELYSKMKAYYLRCIDLSLTIFLERACLFITILCYILLGHLITAQVVFSMAQFFNILQLSMAILFPLTVTFAAESLVSVKRLEAFLLLDESKKPPEDRLRDTSINLINISANWLPDIPVLTDVTLQVRAGNLCAIVGPVGSGKSTLMQMLLSELRPKAGTVKVGGTISYSSQEPWLFSSTIQNNILFGEDFDEEHYNNVITACSLLKDIEQLPKGDRTIVGDRGVSLSGGQRARINLARAVYRKADIYLLDDPLSSVDADVGKALFEECIFKHLGRKTRVVITHQLQYLKKADEIIVLNKGKIEGRGTFEELCNSHLDFTKMLVAAEGGTVEKKHDMVRSLDSSLISAQITEMADSSKQSETHNEELGSTGMSPFKEYVKHAGSILVLITMTAVFILGQTACTGADYWVSIWTNQETIKYSNETHYLSKPHEDIFNQAIPRTIHFEEVNLSSFDQNNGTNYSFIDSDSVFYNMSSNHQNSSTSIVEESFNDAKDNITIDEKTFWESIVDNVVYHHKNYSLLKTEVAIYIYTVLTLLVLIITLGKSLIFFKVCMVASNNLHKNIFQSLLDTSLRFFHITPKGRILNRFSKDMGAVDDIIPMVLMDTIQDLLVTFGVIVVVAVSNIYLILIIGILALCFMVLARIFIKISKKIRFVEGITKSPMFTHIESTLNGIVTIRSFRNQDLVIKEFDDHQDVHSSAWFLVITCNSAFGLWLDIISIIFVTVVTFSFIIVRHYTSVSSSLIGLAISQCLLLIVILQHGIKQGADVISQITSVERILHYSNLDKEEDSQTQLMSGKTIKSFWPSKGLIKFKNVFLAHGPGQTPTLKNINITIFPGEKVGIVGRTGAGKSSLISALFRLAPMDGQIVIDAFDTKTINLHTLRRNISIIPQEPVLFSASLRYNLDPFEEFSADDLWNALDEVEMKDICTSLDFQVSEGGKNFSAGQRQLLCLARAILRNNKILVLDEATSNVDRRTDSLIQATIRRKFKLCTVLTVAHRLNTIMDSDKVIVMDAGKIAEFDHPHLLLQNENSQFHQIVAKSGPAITIQLKKVALESFRSKFGVPP